MTKQTTAIAGEEPRRVSLAEAYAIFDELDGGLNLKETLSQADIESLATYLAAIKKAGEQNDFLLAMAGSMSDGKNLVILLSKVYRLGFMYGIGRKPPTIILDPDSQAGDAELEPCNCPLCEAEREAEGDDGIDAS